MNQKIFKCSKSIFKKYLKQEIEEFIREAKKRYYNVKVIVNLNGDLIETIINYNTKKENIKKQNIKVKEIISYIEDNLSNIFNENNFIDYDNIKKITCLKYEIKNSGFVEIRDFGKYNFEIVFKNYNQEYQSFEGEASVLKYLIKNNKVILCYERIWYEKNKMFNSSGNPSYCKLFKNDENEYYLSKEYYTSPDGKIHKETGPALIFRDIQNNLVEERYYIDGLMKRDDVFLPSLVKYDKEKIIKEIYTNEKGITYKIIVFENSKNTKKSIEFLNYYPN